LNHIEAGKIDKGILGIETDVLNQWRNLVPTYEKRLTSIKDIYLENIEAAHCTTHPHAGKGLNHPD
jgi:hypothetical protein